MSLTLVKKSLSLVDETVATHSDNKPASDYAGWKKLKKLPLRNIKKKKELTTAAADTKKKAAFVVQRIKRQVENDKQFDRVEENIKNLKTLSQSSRINRKLEKKIIDSVQVKKRNYSRVEVDKKSLSVFTEEDFDNFEREYFHS